MSSPAQPTVLPIRLRFADGYQLQASAAVVGANDLLTATHVVYQPQHGGWASELALVDDSGQATPISGWQVWANPQQVYADADPGTLTLGESQYDVALIGLNRLLPGPPLSLSNNSPAPSGSAQGYPQGQALTEIHTDLQHGQDGYSVYQSRNTQLGPGSSGGPLLNDAGQLIGINSAGTPGSATWWADITPFLPQITEQMQANDGLLLDTGLNNSTGPRQISSGVSLPALLPTGQETVGGQVPNAVTVGGEFRVNSYTSNGQSEPAITALSDGGYLVAWMSNGQDGDSYGIYAQRYASNGSAVGEEFRVNTFTTGWQASPVVTALADGGYVVAWRSYNQDGSGEGIYAQRYSSNGSVVGGEFRANSYTSSDQGDPAITMLSDGGYLVVWTSSGQDGSGYGIYAQRYASNGSAVGGEFRINSTTPNNQTNVFVAGLSDGNFVATWDDGLGSPAGLDGSGSGVYAQRFSSTLPASPSLSLRTIYPSFTEGSGGGATPVPLEITRSGDPSNSSSVEWSIVPGSADGSDFSGSTFGSVAFAAGETSKTIQIAVNKDSTVESDETFSVQLKNPVNATLSTSSASMTIANDDGSQSGGASVGGGSSGGASSSGTPADAVLYRFAKLNGNYFYTSNPAEIQSIQDNYLDMMRFEGYAFNCLSGKDKAVYRYALLDNGGGYFYTTDAAERQIAEQHPDKFRAEIVDSSGVQQPAFYAAADSDASATPVYRLKNSQGGYLFTAIDAEKNAAVSQYGYTYEQVAFKVPTLGTPKGILLAAAENQFANEDPKTENGVIKGGGLKYNVIRIGDTSGGASVQWSIKGTGIYPTEADDFLGATNGALGFAPGEASKLIALQFFSDGLPQADEGAFESFSLELSNPVGGQVLVGGMAGRIFNDDLGGSKQQYTEQALSDLLKPASAGLSEGIAMIVGEVVGDVWWL